MKIEWSRRAVRDLDRFALFLAEHHPELAGRVAQAIIAKMDVLADISDWAARSPAGRNIDNSFSRFSAAPMCSDIGSPKSGWSSCVFSTVVNSGDCPEPFAFVPAPWQNRRRETL